METAFFFLAELLLRCYIIFPCKEKWNFISGIGYLEKKTTPMIGLIKEKRKNDGYDDRLGCFVKTEIKRV